MIENIVLKFRLLLKKIIKMKNFYTHTKILLKHTKIPKLLHNSDGHVKQKYSIIAGYYSITIRKIAPLPRMPP